MGRWGDGEMGRWGDGESGVGSRESGVGVIKLNVADQLKKRYINY
ncbi:hypothetical protein [Moorena sp. SIO1F2]|nr:hypothetical protein [Moorena sp. SIO1F2]